MRGWQKLQLVTPPEDMKPVGQTLKPCWRQVFDGRCEEEQLASAFLREGLERLPEPRDLGVRWGVLVVGGVGFPISERHVSRVALEDEGKVLRSTT